MMKEVFKCFNKLKYHNSLNYGQALYLLSLHEAQALILEMKSLNK